MSMGMDRTNEPARLFVSQRDYPGDGRLNTEITALTEAGYAVDMIAVKPAGAPFTSSRRACGSCASRP